MRSACACGGGCPRCAAATGVRAALAEPGRPLDPGARDFMESRFAANFSGVRVHTGPLAAESARAINAVAYTLGRDVVFGEGQYAPGTRAGNRLLAHELAHVVQQHTQPAAVVRREEASGEATAPTTTTSGTTETAAGLTAPAPSYGGTCSGGDTDPCRLSRCGDRVGGISDDLSRALGYVDAAIAALDASPLADNTVRALDWYFNDHGEGTVRTARERLACIRDSLQETRTSVRFGCHPDYAGDALAYVCVWSTPVCVDRLVDVCLTQEHFDRPDRTRAEVMIHECAHRVGLSLEQGPASTRMEDVYDYRPRFLYLDTAEALLNADSYALFASSIPHGVRLTLVMPGMPAFLSYTGGMAAPSTGTPTWYARIYEGLEFQHPILGIFSPTLGIGLSLIGETETGTPPVTAGPSMLASLLTGVRIGDPRPGAAGGGYASFFGGPALAVGLGSTQGVGLGVEAGTAVGYRWRWLDVSAGVGYTYDPTRVAGMEHLYTFTAGISFIPWSVSIPGSH